MAKKKSRKTSGKARAAKRKSAPPKKSARAASPMMDALVKPVKGAEHRTVGHVRLDVGKAGEARVKRMIYPPGFRWSKDMKPAVGTELCMHAHAGFLAHGEIHIEYPDGCVIEHKAPQIVSIEPGHDGWVVGDEPVVIIEFDFGGDTVRRLGMPERHQH
jgi:hypothetical protein